MKPAAEQPLPSAKQQLSECPTGHTYPGLALSLTPATQREAVLQFTSGFHTSPVKLMCMIRNISRRKGFLYVKAPLQVTF